MQQKVEKEDSWDAGGEEEMGKALKGDIISILNPRSGVRFVRTVSLLTHKILGATGNLQQMGSFMLKCLHKDLRI